MISYKNYYIMWYILEFSDISGVPRRVGPMISYDISMISYTISVSDIILKVHDIVYDIIYITISCPISQWYHNHYYLSKYINIKSDLYSYLNINNHIYPIIDITGTLIKLGNTTNYPLPIYTNNRLIIGDYYKNVTYVDNIGDQIGYKYSNDNKGTIFIYKSRVCQ